MKKTSKRTSGSRKRSPRRSRKAPGLAPSIALAAFADVARRQRLRWYVFGAQAVNLYGFPRTTADVDVTVDLGERDPQDLVRALERNGFIPRFRDADFIAQTRVIPVVHAKTQLPFDLVLAGSGLEQAFLDAARIHRVGGREIPVIAPEHLVVTKVIAGRPKDLEDVREILAVTPLDRGRIEELLSTVDAALGTNDLVAVFRSLVRP